MKKLFNRIAAKLRRTPEAHGYDVLHNGAVNKSTAFTPDERDALGLRGLLPYHVSTQESQEEHVLEQLRRKTSDIEKYIYLAALQERNERLFYYTAIRNIEQVMPLIYTPTVGQACKEFSQIFRTPRGLYITPADKGKIRQMLDNWPEKDVRALVITDGQRILGLGDLGANGMGIPIGKLALYSICGGVDPRQCLPVMFDIGTNNETLRNDPLYLGYPHRRLEGKEYEDLMQEFVDAVNDKFPKAMIQFEDFLTPNAYALLQKYRDKTLCFNDDIQGTAGVVLAGVYATARATGQDFKDMRIMFAGAGAAATGIADLIVKGLVDAGLDEKEAYSRIWMIDSKGLVTKGRATMEPHKAPFAQDHAQMQMLDAIKEFKPQMLIGAMGVPGTFSKEVIETMSAINKQPAIFALSNPTSFAECTAEEAYKWSGGRALFASGSPFAPVEHNGKTHRPSQSNNSYVFPGVALGVLQSGAMRVTDSMFLAAAKALAAMVTDQDIAAGALYPPLKNIRDVSAHIAADVMKTAVAEGLSGMELPSDLVSHIRQKMYDPSYTSATVKPAKKPKL